MKFELSLSRLKFVCILSRCDIHQTMNDDFLYSLLIDTELCCTSILNEDKLLIFAQNAALNA